MGRSLHDGTRNVPGVSATGARRQRRTFRILIVVFGPEVIEIMSAALEASINSLPEPVSATQVHYLAESILHTAETGERDVAVLRRIALVELRIAPRG
jgi:hypothetical protein